MSTEGFNSTPKRLMEKDGVLKLEIIENYTPANPEIPWEIIQKRNDIFAKKVEALKSSLLKAK
jgi:hypothetical protein